MKKEDFIKLGFSEADAEKAAAASAEELKGYIPTVRFNEVNEAKKKAEEAVKERDKQIEGLKSATGDAETMKKQIEALQADNKKKDEVHAAEILQIRVDNAVDAAIIAAGAKNAKAVKALLDLSNPKLADDGTVKGLSDQLDKLKTAADSSFLFNASTKPKMKGAKAGEDGHESGDDKPDLSTMSYAELCTYYDEHPDEQE